MPLYEQIIVAMPKTTAQSLVELFKKYTKTIISNGGVVRGIENHGIRPLPEKAKRKYATISGERIVWDARYVSTHIDASPATLVEVDRMLRNDEGVLRCFTVKQTSAAQRVRNTGWRNPYIPKKPKKPYDI